MPFITVDPVDNRPWIPVGVGDEEVQCHECGNYFFWKDGHSECQNGGTEIDRQWNIATGRISEDSIPESIEPLLTEQTH